MSWEVETSAAVLQAAETLYDIGPLTGPPVLAATNGCRVHVYKVATANGSYAFKMMAQDPKDEDPLDIARIRQGRAAQKLLYDAGVSVAQPIFSGRKELIELFSVAAETTALSVSKWVEGTRLDEILRAFNGRSTLGLQLGSILSDTAKVLAQAHAETAIPTGEKAPSLVPAVEQWKVMVLSLIHI